MTQPPATLQVVHYDFISLAPTASPQAVQDLIAEAAGLAALPHVIAVGVIEADTQPSLSRGGVGAADFDLALFFVLDGFTALEPFGTHPAYIAFLQGRAAPLLRGFAGADVALDAPFPEVAPYAACLALAAPDETYDWEVRAALQSWASQATASTAPGLAIGERQRYRGCVAVFNQVPMAPARPDSARYQTSLIAGVCRRLGQSPAP